jgi:hypothetical protein
MSNTRSLKLIDGIYEASDAAEILYTVLNDKIRFHSIQLNSFLERNQGEVSHSESRLKQLKEEKAKIAEIIGEAKDGKKIRLKASIEVDFV